MPHLSGNNLVVMNKKVSLNTYRTRNEIADILGISLRSLHNLLSPNIPKIKSPNADDFRLLINV